MRFHEFKGLAPLRNALSDGHSSPQRNGFRFRVRTLVSLLTPAKFAKQPIIGIATHKCEYMGLNGFRPGGKIPGSRYAARDIVSVLLWSNFASLASDCVHRQGAM